MDILLFFWLPSFYHPSISYTVEVTANGQNEIFLTTNATSIVFMPPVLTCSPYHVRVKASNDLGQETNYGNSIDAYLISDTSELGGVASHSSSSNYISHKVQHKKRKCYVKPIGTPLYKDSISVLQVTRCSSSSFLDSCLPYCSIDSSISANVIEVVV